MKIPSPFKISDFSAGLAPRRGGRLARSRRAARGIALVITLIMLAITLVMAVAFLALAQRERRSVSGSTDATAARLAADSAAQAAIGQITANLLPAPSGNAYNLHLLVSTNYINPNGFNPLVGYVNPTNVNYTYASGGFLSGQDLIQNVQNLWFLPRPPVFVLTNDAHPGNDFRFYLDLNENGIFDPNGSQPVISDDPNNPYYGTNGTPLPSYSPPNVLSNAFVGDPEWIGVLEHPDAPHSKNNHFIARYAFVAVPVGNTLDVNYIHNQAATKTVNGYPTAIITDGYFRNQGVGSWELNLAAFLADLDTNIWNTYSYQQVLPLRLPNQGNAFDDARSLLSYRYGFNYNNLAFANKVLGQNASVALSVFKNDRIDAYSDGLLQVTLNTNADNTMSDGDYSPDTTRWLGSDNTNFFYTLGDFFDANKVSGSSSVVGFTNRLRNAGSYQTNGYHPTYDRYTLYRMLGELGFDSTAQDGKLNLNYSNATVKYYQPVGDVPVVSSISTVVNAETNLVPWTAQNFFVTAADKMLRLYTAEWFKSSPSNFMANYYGVHLQEYLDATGRGVTNYPCIGMTNQIPAFGITNIPVYVNGVSVYSPAVNRLLQMAANLYDASTNSFYPSVFRPIFQRDAYTNIYIMSYLAVTNIVDSGDSQLALPIDLWQLNDAKYVSMTAAQPPLPIFDLNNNLVNVYGVPWIIGAKKGLPNFNKLGMENVIQITRKLQIKRNTIPATKDSDFVFTNQLYAFGISNSIGIECWNSYANGYPNPVQITVRDTLSMWVTNSYGTSPSYFGDYLRTTNYTVAAGWPGRAVAPPVNWSAILLTNSDYYFGTTPPGISGFYPDTYNYGWEFNHQTFDLPQFGLVTTNRLQLFMLDSSNGVYHIIDYVQFAGPQNGRNLNAVFQTNDTRISYDNMWATNVNAAGLPLGIANQLYVSRGGIDPIMSYWKSPATSLTAAKDEIDGFLAFSGLSIKYPITTATLVSSYSSNYLVQVPYTPTATIYDYTSWEANDPLVHYLVSDLNYYGAEKAGSPVTGIHKLPDNNSGVSAPSFSTVNERYQPWGVAAPTRYQTTSNNFMNAYNLIYKDPLMWSPNYWDFPTNKYPSVGWIGRVHRGTPWQTIYLKAHNVLHMVGNGGTLASGTNTWMAWTGDWNIYDAANSAPLEDRLLFDVFTTRFNDNAVRGTLPVNVGSGQRDGGLAAWSALFGGMVVLTNVTVFPPFNTTVLISPSNNWMVVPPAGTAGLNSALGNLVTNINNMRAVYTNTDGVVGTFEHPGDILSVAALTEQSPFLSLDTTNQQKGISDEVYEWLPQQMMGLVRASEPRYVLYCYGQALRPAPNGTVLSGNNALLITNYQVVAESALRAVIRVDNANTSTPRPVVESSTVLPSY